MARGDYAEDLHELAAGGTGAFLAVGVILPSLLGTAIRRWAGERRIGAAKPALKLVNTGVLLFLNYSNPMAMNTWACNKYGKVRTIGLCHGVQGAHRQIANVIEHWKINP